MSTANSEALTRYAIEKASDAGLKAFLAYAQNKGIAEDTIRNLWVNAFILGWIKGMGEVDLDSLIGLANG